MAAQAHSPQLHHVFGLHRTWTQRYVFNNLNALLNGPPNLSPDTLLRSLARYRGGYCHELNSAFKAHLERQGIEATPYLARVVYRTGDRVLPPTHLYLLTQVAGRVLLCDTGFGNGLLWPIELDTESARPQSTLAFQVRSSESGRGLWISEQGQWDELYRLGDEPSRQAHIDTANHYSATSPDSIFCRNLVLTHYTRGGRRRLLNLRYMNEAQQTVLLDSRSAFDSCLQGQFDVRPTPVEVGRLFEIACNAARPAA